MEKGCETCNNFSHLEGCCMLGIADELESRDCDTSECSEYELDLFWNELEV